MLQDDKSVRNAVTAVTVPSAFCHMMLALGTLSPTIRNRIVIKSGIHIKVKYSR